MRIVFCDDNPEMLKQIQKMVQHFFADKKHLDIEYAEYASGDALLANETIVDIAFLDVEMHGQTGLQVAKKLKESNPRIKVFIVTAHFEYVDDAMELQLFHCFKKPIDRAWLYRRLTEAVKQYAENSVQLSIETTDGKITTLRSHEIVHIRGLKRCCEVHTTTAIYMVQQPLAYFTERLAPATFTPSYRNELVNLAYVTNFEKDTIFLKVGEKQSAIYLSRRNYSEFKLAYLKYVEAAR